MGKSLKEQLEGRTAPVADSAQAERAKAYVEQSRKDWFRAFLKADLNSPEFIKLLHAPEAKELFSKTSFDKRVEFLRTLELVDYPTYKVPATARDRGHEARQVVVCTRFITDGGTTSLTTT